MKIRLVLAAAFATVAAATTAHADNSTYYIGLGAGLSAPVSSDPVLIRPNTPDHLTHTSFNAGWGGVGKLGYQMGGLFRTELEVGYRRASLSHMDVGTATGNEGVFSAMGNLLFDLGSNPAIGPYIGGGLGGAWVKWHHVQPTNSATLVGILPEFDASSAAALQYQAIAGITVPLSGATKFFAEYHYIGTSSTTFRSKTLTDDVYTGHKDTSHNFLIGVRFNFGSGWK